MWFIKISKVWVPTNEDTAALALADGHAIKWVGGSAHEV